MIGGQRERTRSSPQWIDAAARRPGLLRDRHRETGRCCQHSSLPPFARVDLDGRVRRDRSDVYYGRPRCKLMLGDPRRGRGSSCWKPSYTVPGTLVNEMVDTELARVRGEAKLGSMAVRYPSASSQHPPQRRQPRRQRVALPRSLAVATRSESLGGCGRVLGTITIARRPSRYVADLADALQRRARLHIYATRSKRRTRPSHVQTRSGHPQVAKLATVAVVHYPGHVSRCAASSTSFMPRSVRISDVATMHLHAGVVRLDRRGRAGRSAWKGRMSAGCDPDSGAGPLFRKGNEGSIAISKSRSGNLAEAFGRSEGVDVDLSRASTQ